VEPVLVSVPPAGIEVTAYPIITEPPLETGVMNVTVADAFPAVAKTEVGALGTIALDVYVKFAGLVSPPLFDGVRVINPAIVGVMVNV